MLDTFLGGGMNISFLISGWAWLRNVVNRSLCKAVTKKYCTSVILIFLCLFNCSLSCANSKSDGLPSDTASNCYYEIEGPHTLRVINDATSSDKYIVTAGFDSSIKIWDKKTGTVIKTLNDHKRSLKFAVISPDNHYLATYDLDGVLILWDLVWLNKIRENKLNKHAQAITFSRDSTKIYVASSRRGVNVLALPYLEPEGHIEIAKSDDDYSVKALVEAPNQRCLLLGLSNQCILVVDLQGGKVKNELWGHMDRVGAIEFIDDRFFVSSGSSGSLIEWDLKTGLKVREFRAADNYVGSLVYIPSKKFIFGATDSRIFVWSYDTSEVLGVLDYDGRGATIKLFSRPSDDIIYFVNMGSIFKINTLDMQVSSFSRYDAGYVWDADITIDNTHALIVHDGGLVNLWDLKKDTLQWSFRANSPVVSFNMHEDKNQLFLGHRDGTVSLHDLLTSQELMGLGLHNNRVLSVDVSGDGRFLLTGGYDKKAVIYDLYASRVSFELNHKDPVDKVFFIDGTDKLVTYSRDNKVYLWEVLSGKMLNSFKTTGIVYFPGNEYFIQRDKGKLFKVNILTREISQILDDHRMDAEIVANFDINKIIKLNTNYFHKNRFMTNAVLFDLNSGINYGLSDYSRNIRNLKFSMSNSLLMAFGNNGSLKIYDLKNINLVKEIMFFTDGEWVFTSNSNVSYSDENMKNRLFKKCNDDPSDLFHLSNKFYELSH